MARHRVEIEEPEPLWKGQPQEYRAVCRTCPWRGPRFPRHERAELSGDWHRQWPTQSERIKTGNRFW